MTKIAPSPGEKGSARRTVDKREKKGHTYIYIYIYTHARGMLKISWCSPYVYLEWYRYNFFIKKLYLCHLKRHKYNFLIAFISLQMYTKKTLGNTSSFLYIYIYIYHRAIHDLKPIYIYIC
jgi:hypothetical protein